MYKTKNYLVYVLIELVGSLLNNLIIKIYVKTRYNEYFVKPNHLSEIDKKTIISEMKVLAVANICAVGINSTDSMIISKFVGLEALANYSNYLLIAGALYTLTGHLINGVVPSLGNFLNSKSINDSQLIYGTYDFICQCVGSLFFVGVFLMIRPTIIFLFGSQFYLGSITVFLISFNYFLNIIFTPINNFVLIKGLFKQKRKCDFIQVVLNIILSLLFVNIIGMNGVFLGTTISIIISKVTLLILVYESYLNIQVKEALKKISYCLIYTFVKLSFFLIIFEYFLPQSNSLLSIFTHALIILIFSFVLDY
ncbi:MAG: hypothetical protein RR623_08615, partial [Bacilli bacterium]